MIFYSENLILISVYHVINRCFYSSNSQSLTVLDNRTNKLYEIPIENNTIPALKFKEITASSVPGSREEDESGKGLR